MPGEIVFSVIGLDGQPEVITNAPAATAWAGEPLPPQPWYKNLYDSLSVTSLSSYSFINPDASRVPIIEFRFAQVK